jgi:hypothetical protein
MIDLDILKKLLIDQYLLHEIQHHAAYAIPDDEPIKREPRAHSLVDIYKCLHQGEFGVGHLIDAPEHFQHRLMQEMSGIEPISDEPILENVSIDSAVMRLNLRPFIALHADDVENACHILADVCIQSAEIVKGNREHFFAILNAFRDLNRAGELKVGKAIYAFQTEMVDFFLKEIMKFLQRMGDIPVLSHSSNYRDRNHPSYRVVDVSVIRKSKLAFLFEKGNNWQRSKI